MIKDGDVLCNAICFVAQLSEIHDVSQIFLQVNHKMTPDLYGVCVLLKIGKFLALYLSSS